MTAHLIKHSLRIAAGGNDGYHPEGWNPKLKVTVMGETPPDAELVWTMHKPDGSLWFEHTVAMPQLADEEMHTASLQKWDSGTDITDAGTCSFTLRLVMELDGIDELLHDGAFTVTRLEGTEHEFGVDHTSLLTTGLVALDVYDQHDAPKLRATAFLGGSPDSYEVEAHIFHGGKRFAKASDVETGYDFTSNDGTTLAREFIAEFDTTRGWNNLRDQGWGDDDWHMLDTNDGAYEIKFTRGGKVNRTMAFEVVDGRIVKDDVIEPDFAGRPSLWRTAMIVGTFDGDIIANPDAPRAYGDLDTSLIDFSSDGMYWFCNGPAEVSADNGPAFDEETTEQVSSLTGTISNLLWTWEQTMTDGFDPDQAPSFQSNFLLQCEVAASDIERVDQRFAALGGVADEHELEFNGEPITLAAAVARVDRVRDLATSYMRIARGEVEDILTPYRAALRGDKLAIFEDHPAPDFLYYTTNKHVIETPEQLAEAELWFFEGANDTKASGSVDGHSVEATVSGWRVLGYRFDGDHAMVDEFETQGTGSSAPKSAFVGR